MIKKIYIIFIYINLFLKINSSSFLKPEEAINELNTEFTLDSKYKDIIIKLFEEAYVYNEIIKNPPKPSFKSDYFNKYNIKEELENLFSKKYKYYLYQDIKTAFAFMKDPNIEFEFTNYFREFSLFEFYFPIKFIVRDDGNGTKIYCMRATTNNIINKQFDKQIFDTIDSNENIPIQYINNNNPFDYIANFGQNYNSLKNPHGNFAYNLNIINNDKHPTFKSYPLSLEQLNNFNVVYENGKSFNTNLVILKTGSYNLYLTNFFNNKNLLLDSKIKERKLTQEIYDYFPYNYKSLSINSQFNVYYNNYFYCKIDQSKEINIYYIKNFIANTEEEQNAYMDKIKECATLFDSNNYPIIVINRFTGGDNLFLSHFLLEIISPLTTVNYYGAYRKTSSISNLQDSDINQDSSIYYCSSINKEYLLEKENIIDYGEGITNKLTQAFIVKGLYTRTKINEITKNLKNKRKPTEILIYTDGHSLSAAGAFMKYLQKNGGAIIAGYFYNQNKENIPFDSGLGPSITFSSEILKNMVPDYKTISDQIKLKIPVGALFYSPSDLKVPLEYDTNNVDVITDIYQFDESDFTIFIDKGKEILNKYKNNCNPNSKIVLISEKCDGKFENSFTHGGFMCGENGVWTNKCTPSYCDFGYLFDSKRKSCVVDICHIYNDKESLSVGIIILVVVLCLVALVVLGIVYIKCKRRHSKHVDSNYINFKEGNKIS